MKKRSGIAPVVSISIASCDINCPYLGTLFKELFDENCKSSMWVANASFPIKVSKFHVPFGNVLNYFHSFVANLSFYLNDAG